MITSNFAIKLIYVYFSLVDVDKNIVITLTSVQSVFRTICSRSSNNSWTSYLTSLVFWCSVIIKLVTIWSLGVPIPGYMVHKRLPFILKLTRFQWEKFFPMKRFLNYFVQNHSQSDHRKLLAETNSSLLIFPTSYVRKKVFINDNPENKSYK